MYLPLVYNMRDTDSYVIVVLQSFSHAWLFVTPRTAASQASLSFTISQSLLKLMSIESVMPSKHLILCCPLSHLPSIFLRIRVFSNESALHIRWPKYWSIDSYGELLNIRTRKWKQGGDNTVMSDYNALSFSIFWNWANLESQESWIKYFPIK